MNIGDRIRKLRERRDWTQKKLAEKVGINHSVFNRIESGERKVRSEELTKIAEVLDVTPSSLLGKEDGNVKENTEEDPLLTEIRNMSDKQKEKLRRVIEIMNEE